MSDLLARLKNSPFRWPVILLVVTLILLALMSMTSDSPEPSKASKPMWRVETLPVSLAPQSVEVRLYGRVETPRLVTLTAATNAYVDVAAILPGEAVDEGDLVVSLDQRDLKLSLAQRQADLNDTLARLDSETLREQADKDALEQEKLLLDSVRREHKRQQSLKQKNLVSVRKVDIAKEALVRQQLTVITRQQQVSDAT